MESSKSGLTHHVHAQNILGVLEKKTGQRPVACMGSLYLYEDGLWVPTQKEKLEVIVAQNHDGLKFCKRKSDYTPIALLAMNIALDEEFFKTGNVPKGVACSDGFHQLGKDGTWISEDLAPEHRQRIRLPVSPSSKPAPLFESFLADTFKGVEEQMETVQEIAGAAITGEMAVHEKVASFKGPTNSGKSTLVRILSNQLPDEAVGAVDPSRWDSEYYLAALAGKRLNVVGELDDDKPLPVGAFKKVTGRDRLQGKHPTHRPFDFYNEACHIFNTNVIVPTRDHSMAFYRRWIMVDSPNTVDLALVGLLLSFHIDINGAVAVGCWGIAWTLALAVMVIPILRTTPPQALSAKPAREASTWAREARPFHFYRISLALLAQVGVIALDRLHPSAAAVGAYAVAMSTVTLAVVLTTSTNRFYARQLSIKLEQQDYARVSEVGRERLRWLLPTMAIFLAIIFGFGREILGLFRPEFVEEGITALYLLAITVTVSVMFSLAPTYLKYRKLNRSITKIVAGAAVTQLILLVLLVPHFAATGAALAYAVSMCGMYGIFSLRAHRELKQLKTNRETV